MRLFRSGSAMTVAVATLILGACAAWTPPISKEEKLSGDDALLYGRFEIDSPKELLGFDGYQTMGFVFSCEDLKTYVIRFSVERPLQVIKVSPATCTMTEMVYTDGNGEIKSRKPVRNGFFENLSLKPGSAYYLGDYFAVVKNTRDFRTLWTTWTIKEIKDRYWTTTDELKTAYPNLAGFETVSLPIGK